VRGEADAIATRIGVGVHRHDGTPWRHERDGDLLGAGPVRDVLLERREVDLLLTADVVEPGAGRVGAAKDKLERVDGASGRALGERLRLEPTFREQDIEEASVRVHVELGLLLRQHATGTRDGLRQHAMGARDGRHATGGGSTRRAQGGGARSSTRTSWSPPHPPSPASRGSTST